MAKDKFDFKKSIREISESYKSQVWNKAKFEKNLLKETKKKIKEGMFDDGEEDAWDTGGEFDDDAEMEPDLPPRFRGESDLHYDKRIARMRKEEEDFLNGSDEFEDHELPFLDDNPIENEMGDENDFFQDKVRKWKSEY